MDRETDEKPKMSLYCMTSVYMDENGRMVIEKTYQDRLERVMFEDMFDLQMVLEQATVLFPQETCPECGEKLQTWFVKEYTCERCDMTISENYLEHYEFIKGMKSRMESGPNDSGE